MDPRALGMLGEHCPLNYISTQDGEGGGSGVPLGLHSEF